MTDELDEAEKTRLALQAQVQRLESVVAKLEAELEEDDNPAARRRYDASVQKLAEVQAQLAPLNAKNENQAFDDLQKSLGEGLEQQLAALRHVWRKHRHPRVADLIDILSTELLSTLPPIPAVELPAVFARRDPTEVSRLLTMPWPTTPELEELVVQAILWLPDDPRVARICAREIDLQRIGRGYYENYERIYDRLNALGDVRQIPVLEKQLGRGGRRTSELDRKALAEHRRLKPELPPEFEPLIEQLEGRWADWVQRREERSRRTAEHLERVLAQPHETAHRLVFADWLSELGDPRGELINLQLGAKSEESQRRQEDLIAAYWSEWCRPILDGLKSAPRFEEGFPAAGELRIASITFEDPLWRTFTSLTKHGAIESAELVKEPNLLSVRELRGVYPVEMKALLKTGAPLTSIALTRRYDIGIEEEPLTQRDFAAMPTLRRLELEEEQARSWVNAFVSLKTIKVTVDRATAEGFISLMEAAPIEALEVMIHGTTTRLERAEPGGPFVKAIVLSGNRHLLNCLAAFPRTLTSLTSLEPAAIVTSSSMDELKVLLRRFPALVSDELPMRVRPPRRYFRMESERIFSRREVVDSLTRHFDLQLDHVVGPAWDDRREFWTELGERGEPTLITNQDTFTAVLPVLEAQALSTALKKVLGQGYSRVTKISFEGRELALEYWGKWPALEQFRVFLGEEG